MDLDDIDKWSRELLQKEARKRGYINASMYSRPELIRLILRHDYVNTKSARATARSLLDKAKSAIRSGWDVAAHAARSKTKSAAHPPGGGWEENTLQQAAASERGSGSAAARGPATSARGEGTASRESPAQPAHADASHPSAAGGTQSSTEAGRARDDGSPRDDAPTGAGHAPHRAREYESFPPDTQPSGAGTIQPSRAGATKSSTEPGRAREYESKTEGTSPGPAAHSLDRAREGESASRARHAGTAPADDPNASAAASPERQSRSLSLDLPAAGSATRTSPRSMFPGAAPPASVASPQPSPQPSAAAASSAHVDPTPELRPPALGGPQGEPPPPLELQTALTDAQLSAAATPITEGRAPSVRVDPKPELFPPAKDDLRSVEPNAPAAAPSSADASTADPLEYGSSPWSLHPAAPTQAPAVVTLGFEPSAPPTAASTSKDGNHLTYGPHPEHGLSLHWQVTADGVERARAVLGSPGELAVRIVAVRTDDHAVVHTEVLDHGPVENRGVWTAPLPPNAARYVSAVGLRTPERFVSIVHAST